MEHETIDLKEQIERCRRLASLLTDAKMRNSLEDLANEYERKLKKSGATDEGFMLRKRSG